MPNLKKSNSWMTSTFEYASEERPPQRKRSCSQMCHNEVTETLISCDIFLKRSNTSNLSTLLKACEPKKSSDLAISRQKQQEILNWLQHKPQKGQPVVLVLSGPSGCGKTIATKVLAKETGFEILEWINPMDQPIMDENYRVIKQSEKFEDYLVRATRYNSLLSNNSRRLLLVKDFPNIYYEDNESFHAVLQKYFDFGKEPLVFICTETGNSRLLLNLFPSDIKEKYDIAFISINAVTQTAMKTMLKRVSEILNSTASHMLNVTQDKIDETLSNNIGDVRSAMFNLIFISLKVSGKYSQNDCTSREETLGLLHGIGRVINPKRTEEENTWKFIHDPDEIAGHFYSLSSVFINFLQENYLNTIRSIEDADAAANILSIADVLNSEWRDPNLSKLVLSHCIRGVMVANQKPVNGWNPVRKPQSKKSTTQRYLDVAEIEWYKSLISSNEKYVMVEDIEEIADIEEMMIE